MTKKSCNLLEKRVELPQEWGSGTSSASSDEQSNSYIKDLSWLYFDDEPSTEEKQQVKDQHTKFSAMSSFLKK